jgi:RecB family endonuclease NucS
VRPSAVRLFRERGIDIHEVQQSITAERDGEQLEIDLLVVNNENVVVIECKSNLSVEDVNDHLERLEKVKRLLPRYNNCKVLGAVAGMVIPDNVATYAIKKGLYVIGQNGDHLELRNEQSFTAKAW